MSASEPTQRAIEEWLNKAEEDYRAMLALAALNDEGAYSSTVCFHAQQCIEKLFKTLLVARHLVPAKTHNLVELSVAVSSAYESWQADESELRFLTYSAVEFRYPGASAEWEDAREAAALCEDWRTQLLELLPNRKN